MNQPEPIDTRPLIQQIDRELINLLKTFSPGEWNRKVNQNWSVKDTAAHLLDGNLRRLTSQRDRYPVPGPPDASEDHSSLVKYLANLNQEWVDVSKRFSPGLLIDLFEFTSQKTAQMYESTEMDSEAIFPVSWAGHETSPAWFDIAREYSEKWYHQQQIREVTARDLLTEEKWIEPLINTFMRGMPFAYDKHAPGCEPGTEVQITISDGFIQLWVIRNDDESWKLYLGKAGNPVFTIQAKADIAWRILAKWKKYEELESKLWVDGDTAFIKPFMRFIGFVK